MHVFAELHTGDDALDHGGGVGEKATNAHANEGHEQQAGVEKQKA